MQPDFEILNGMKAAEERHRPGAMLPAQIEQQYNEIISRPGQSPARSFAPGFDPVPIRRIAKGVGLSAIVLGGGFIAVKAVVAVAAAVVLFVETYALAIGGGAIAVIVIASAVSGRKGSGTRSASTNTTVYNNTVIFNQNAEKKP